MEEMRYRDWCEIYKEDDNARFIEAVTVHEYDECHEKTLEHIQENCHQLLWMWKHCPIAWGDHYS
jgi:hypothetical protein